MFIGFVPVHVTELNLADAFMETFDSSVMVRFSKEKVNRNNMKYKSATIEVITSSRALTHFISQIHEYGSNTFMADKIEYRVQLTTVREEPTPIVKTVKPYIM